MESRIVKYVRPGLLALFCTLAAACDPFAFGSTPGSSQKQDLAQYDQLELMLEANRTAFASNDFSNPYAVDNTLFLYNYYGSYPGLHGYNKRTGRHVAYKFGVRIEQGYGYAASDDLVLPRSYLSSKEIRAYAADQENTLLGSINIYSLQQISVSGSAVYVVTKDETGTWLKKWAPGMADAVSVRSLDEATGTRIGSISDFRIDGSVLLLIEGEDDRLWRLDLGAQRATLLPSLVKNAQDIDLRADGVMYVASSGLYFIDTATLQQTKISDLIEDNPYRINSTFADAHHFSANFARFGKYVIYRSRSGIFSYDRQANKIQPLLLDSRGPTIDGVTHLYPVVVKGGFLYVKSLEGAAGNTYEMDLNKLLN